MREFFIMFFLTDLAVLTLIYSVLSVIYVIQHFFHNGIITLKKPFKKSISPDLVNQEEDIYDTAFLEDMADYDARIMEMRDTLKTKTITGHAMPDLNPVEIITDEYEKQHEII